MLFMESDFTSFSEYKLLSVSSAIVSEAHYSYVLKSEIAS